MISKHIVTEILDYLEPLRKGTLLAELLLQFRTQAEVNPAPEVACNSMSV